MAAVVAIPGASPYRGNYQSFRSVLMNAPPEGNMTVPVAVKWDGDTDSGAVWFNLISQTNLQISQICALYVDNLENSQDVEIVFPDTQFRLDVPAFSEGLFPVVTNALNFYASCPAASDGDSTFIQILNFNPPPIAIEKSNFSVGAANNNIAVPSGNNNTVLFQGAGVLRGFDIFVRVTAVSADDAVQVQILDGIGGTVLFSTSYFISSANGVQNLALASMTGLQIPFTQALVVHLIDNGGDVTSGVISAQVYYSTDNP